MAVRDIIRETEGKSTAEMDTKLKNIHIRYKAAVMLRWNYPSLFLPRFNFVF